MIKKITTIMFLQKDGQILLAMKKRGFGAGKWNGAGGKANPDESPKTAAIRECQEEIGVTPTDPKLMGRLDFYDDDVNHDCHVYIATSWEGEVAESEEMRPQWFAIKDIPYDAMWAADRLWMPLVISGKSFEGKVVFSGNNLVSQDIRPVSGFKQDD